MSTAKKDKTISALEAVHAALKPLSGPQRTRVLASVRTLLEIPSGAPDKHWEALAEGGADNSPVSPPVDTSASSTRPLSIRELIQDKKLSHPQLITLFAYYREKTENRPSFSRDDLKRYYNVSRQTPPANYDRDFVKAVQEGWIHEDGENSYITSKGIEAVATGFTIVSRKPSREGRPTKRHSKTKKKGVRKNRTQK
jgi:hypothetical protein